MCRSKRGLSTCLFIFNEVGVGVTSNTVLCFGEYRMGFSQRVFIVEYKVLPYHGVVCVCVLCVVYVHTVFT